MSGFLNEDTVTKSELLEARDGPRPLVLCEECQEPYTRKRKDQRFCSARCAGRFNAKVEYGPTGKPAKVVEDQAVVDAMWIEPPARRLQPFTEDELATIAEFAGIDAAKVRGIAWLTALKLEASL